MKNTVIPFALYVLIFTFLSRCATSTEQHSPTLKNPDGDPFTTTTRASQFFDLDADRDQVIEGEDGTLIVLPQGCLLDGAGKRFDKKIRVELAEFYRPSDMITANLTTTSDGQPLVTDGMIFFNATTADGVQLRIDAKRPVYIEMPTPEKQAGMMVYKGIRDQNGEVNWTSPKPLETWLTAVDIYSLDFLPDGFQEEVERSVPFGNYREATLGMVDSLYYSFSVPSFRDALNGLLPTAYNEPYFNQNRAVINGAYSDASYVQQEVGAEASHGEAPQPQIDPAMIKVLKSERFQNTLIATRAFEKRLQWIFKSCDNAVLRVYIENLDKNLWELDQQAAQLVKGDSQLKATFERFASERLTKVRDGGRYAVALRNYFNSELKKQRAECVLKRKALLTDLKKKNKEVAASAEAYKKVLFKREKHRMESYGFEWTETGWINIDNGTLPKDWGPQQLEVVVQNAMEYDRTYVYVYFDYNKSLCRLNNTDKAHFHVGNAVEKEMNMPNTGNAFVITIAYKGEMPAFELRPFKPGAEKQMDLTAKASTMEKLKKRLTLFGSNSTENSIEQDLEYMKKFYIEEQRQKSLREEVAVMERLWQFVFPCNNYLHGQILFKENCATCHHPNGIDPLVGPPLRGVERRWAGYPRSDLYRFIRNSQSMIARRHPLAVKTWNEWQPLIMTDFQHLSDAEIEAILYYLRG
jgi:cytochrome c2